jgi:hypothetical protein
LQKSEETMKSIWIKLVCHFFFIKQSKILGVCLCSLSSHPRMETRERAHTKEISKKQTNCICIVSLSLFQRKRSATQTSELHKLHSHPPSALRLCLVVGKAGEDTRSRELYSIIAWYVATVAGDALLR